MFRRRSVLVLLLSVFAVNLTQGCHDLQNVFMTVKDRSGTWFNKTVSECIQRTVFDGRTAVEIHIKNQYIPNLGKDYVKNLVKLDILEFKNCGIETIARNALRNLPVLRIVGVTHNPKLKLITGGIFDIFETIHILRLNNNNINTITDEALSNMTLQEVNFSYNNFTNFDPVWFAYSPYIKHLYFQNNRIQKIQKKAFDTMRELQNINFANNKINDIGYGAFGKLRNLRTLNLRNNRLKKLNFNSFPNNLEIESLNLAGNLLLNIDSSVLSRLSLNEIILDYNYFICACYSDLIQYFNKNNVIVTKADNCNLNYLPYCIAAGPKCIEPEVNTNDYDTVSDLIEKYNDAYKTLSSTDKKCAQL